MFAGAYPGFLFDWMSYDPRFPFVGTQGDVKMVSGLAIENILPGTLVQASGNGVRAARDLNNLVGIASLDPHKYDRSLVWNQYDVIPIVRRGTIFVLYTGGISPKCATQPGLDTVTTGAFNISGTPVPRCAYSIASQAYYDNGDTGLQGASDLIDSPLPNPVGISDTLFGEGCALVEINL